MRYDVNRAAHPALQWYSCIPSTILRYA